MKERAFKTNTGSDLPAPRNAVIKRDELEEAMRYFAIGGTRPGTSIHTLNGWIIATDATPLDPSQKAELESRGYIVTPAPPPARVKVPPADPVDDEAQRRIAEQRAMAEEHYREISTRATRKRI